MIIQAPPHLCSAFPDDPWLRGRPLLHSSSSTTAFPAGPPRTGGGGEGSCGGGGGGGGGGGSGGGGSGGGGSGCSRAEGTAAACPTEACSFCGASPALDDLAARLASGGEKTVMCLGLAARGAGAEAMALAETCGLPVVR